MLSSAVWISLATAGALINATPAPSSAKDELTSSRVTGGSNAKDCAWPAVLLLGTHSPSNGAEVGCTGTLVHPELILYAAHCGNPYIVIFGEDRKGKQVLRKEDFAKVGRYPGWKNDSMSRVDWAYIRLKTPITDTPTTPVVAGCEYDAIQKNGNSVYFAGYSKNNSTAMDAIVLRWAKTQITAISGGTIRSGGKGVTACSGDSGGPMLAKLPDQSWRTIGIASTISNLRGCGKPGVWNTYSQIRREMIKWVEGDSGIDITPCFDLDGTPTPGPKCDDFRAYSGNPNAPQGKRANRCVESLSLPAGDYCKVPKSEADPEPEEGSSSSSGGEDEETGTSTGDASGSTDESEPDSSGEDTQSSEPDQTQESSPEPTPEDSQEPEPEPEPEPEEDSPEADPSEDEPTKRPSGGCSLAPAKPLTASLLLGLCCFGYRRRSRSPFGACKR